MSKTNAGTGEASDRTERFFFQVGFQRCGTTALAAFFERCWIPAVHYDEGRPAKRMRVSIEAGARPLGGYDERYRAFTNMNWSAADDYYDAFKHYGALRCEMCAHYELRFGTSDLARVRQCWLEDWEAYHRKVVAEIPADELLVFDIESDPPQRLCDFIGVPRDRVRLYTRENATMNRLGNLSAKLVPRTVKVRMPAPFKRRVQNLLRAR